MSKEHSPTPWAQHTFLIKSKHGDFVAHCGMGNLPPSRSSESEANAGFIVRAVNNHESLKEALGELLHRFRRHTCERAALCGKCGAIAAAQAVLALADKDS